MSKKHTVLRLGKYMMKYRYHLLLAIILTIVSNLFALIGPMLSGYAIDAIEPGVGKVAFDKVFHYALLMLLFFIASSILSYLLSVLMIQISRKIVYQMRKDVFDRLMELPIGYFDTHQTGDIISKISYDIDTINTSLSTDLVQICTSIITVLGALSMMVVISPKLVFVFAITVPLSIILTRAITKRTRPLFRKRSTKLGEMNGFVEEMITGQRTLKAYHQEENTIRKFQVKNKEAIDAYYRSEYYGSTTGPCVNFINNLSLTLISVFGALLYLSGSMTIGNISSFILYSRKFSGPINEAANIISEFQSALAAAERVFRLMDEEPEPFDLENCSELTDIKGDVQIQDVSFGYTKENIILRNLSVHAAPGKMIAIVGPTGSGKTTLINLLMRFYDVNSGNIYVDKNEIRDVTRQSLRSSYAMVLQDTWLFTGTIFENIAYGKENITREEVIDAAKAAKIHSFIKRLPKGYDTILSDEGTNISKGQKQLITIARAMLLDTNMLILDEATSNVDTRTEQHIQQAMRRIMSDKTCLVIAHRLSTIRGADLILVVKDGSIVERGTHKDLMGRDGEYRKMYWAQFE